MVFDFVFNGFSGCLNCFQWCLMAFSGFGRFVMEIFVFFEGRARAKHKNAQGMIARFNKNINKKDCT